MNGFSDPTAEHGGWEFDLETSGISWSDGLFRIHGVRRSNFEPTVESVRELIHPEDLERYAVSVRKATASRTPFAIQHRIVRPDGAVRTVVVRGAFMEGIEGRANRLMGTTHDVTGREGAEERLWHLANHDSLTGLFNRRRLMEELAREVAVARRSGSQGTVLMIDLDRFKDINDSLGHVAGDNLLVRVAEQLRRRLRATDTLARLGGDEFAIVLPSCSTTQGRRVAEDLREGLADAASVRVAGRERAINASVGVAPFGPAQQDADGLLVEADLAMYRAKAQGGARVEVFDEEMRAELAARVQVEAELRDALDQDQLEVFYQPIISLEDGAPVGCEALVRWRHPRHGLVEPEWFVPVAEEHGLISQIGAHVLLEACTQAHEWREAGHNITISVNVSPLQLVRDDIVGEIRQTLQETGLPAPLLCIEITETSLIDDAASIAPALEAVRELGVRIAIDDFGGGTSSLSFLSVLPIDVIKIDRLFIEGLPRRRDDRAIVAAVMSMADELELSVIAEGVEEERQHGELRELGCRFAQGFLYANPVPAAELDLDGYSAAIQPGVGDPFVIREFMRQIGIPARVGME